MNRVVPRLPIHDLRSVYGPRLVVERADTSNGYAICGHYGNLIADAIRDLPRNAVFIDVGANCGLFSLIADEHLKDGEVFSFEPNPRTYQALLANIELNQATRISPFNFAVGPIDEMARLTLHENASGLSRISSNGEVVIPVRNPCYLFDISSRFTLMKVDVEGYELEVIRAFLPGHLKEIDQIIVEINASFTRKYGYQPIDIYRLLSEHGFNPRFGMGHAGHYDEIFDRV